MIALTTTTRQLELDLAAASSTALDIVVVFRDIRAEGVQDSFGAQLSTSNGTSDVVVCSSPQAGVIRVIETLSVGSNSLTLAPTVRIYYDESGTEYDIMTATLNTGEQLYYEDKEGWSVRDSGGRHLFG